MKSRAIVLLVPILFLVLWAFSDRVSAEVIIVNETKPSFYAVSEMSLKGDLDTNKLSLAGAGQVITGEKVKVYLLGRASDLLIDNLKVNGRDVPISFDEKGYYMVLDEGAFEFQGELAIRTVGQVRLYVPGPVNALTFNLKHGYAIHGDQYGLFGDEVLIQRSEKVAMLADGSFKYTFAERNSFYYQVNYKSFGSSLGQAALSLRNGENVVSVLGAKDYSVKDGQLVLELEGDSANVVVTGTFGTGSIIVPLEEGRHHVLVESDPQKKLTISTSAEEIDLKQSTAAPSYSNARAFLAGKDTPIRVSVTDLQMFPSLAASVSYATNRIAITEKGSMLAELEYRYSNTGMDYISVDAPGTPLYAATGYRDAVKLTKDAGKLFLSFPKAQDGTLDMIYFDTRKPLMPVDYIDVPVANTDLTITTANTQIILPEDYIVLWTFGAKGGSELPSLEAVFIFMILLGGIGYMMRQRIGFAVLYLLFSVGLYYFSVILLLISVIASLVFLIRKNISGQSLKWMLAGAGVLIVLILITVAFFAVLSMGMSGISSASRQAVVMESNYATVDKAAPSLAMRKSMDVIGTGAGAINVPVREGVLPVRLELPSLGKTVSVTSNLVHKDDPLKISIVIMAGWLRYILYLISLAAGISCLKDLKRAGRHAKEATKPVT